MKRSMRAEDGAVDHHRPLQGAVLGRVLQVEALRQVEVELEGADLPLAAQHVVHEQVDLGAVEGALVSAPPRTAMPDARSASRRAPSAVSQTSSLPMRLSGRSESVKRGLPRPKAA